MRPVAHRLLSAVVILLLGAAASVSAQSSGAGRAKKEVESPDATTATLKRLSIEELTRISVVSVSRHTEPAAEAAASLTIVTSDIIRRAGVTTLPDAIRLAMGVSVARDGHTWAISARGFGASTANKMAVFIDGRSVYTPLFSGVFWDAQDVVLADVDRIEVIRGAGGTLWGANAANGVINIITKLARDTKGLLVQAGGGNQYGIGAVRYGGALGQDSAYRVYAKVRRFNSQPYLSGETPDEVLLANQVGARMDFGSTSTTSATIQGDFYSGSAGLSAAPQMDLAGGNTLIRVRHTYASGGQLQLQAYYDGTFRKPPQYTEHRNTADVELQYRFSLGKRHDIVSGAGYNASHDVVDASANFFFDPPSRTTSLTNVFVQDEIALAPGRLALIAGSKFENNTYTGFEVQPTVRLRWVPHPGRVVWGGVSRAVRMPARFDTDLRFTGGTSTVLLTGNPDFRSETVLAREAGIRILTIPRVSFSATAFVNSYDDLRTQEPTPPTGFPIVVGNKEHARVAGTEIASHIEFAAWWQTWVGYTFLSERFRLDASSLDTTGGSSEHNDPAHQFWFRSFLDLPAGFTFDVVGRRIGKLPRPAVPAYTELALRVSHPLGRQVTLEVVGANLLHRRHQEFAQLGRPHVVPRSGFVQLTWTR